MYLIINKNFSIFFGIFFSLLDLGIFFLWDLPYLYLSLFAILGNLIFFSSPNGLYKIIISYFYYFLCLGVLGVLWLIDIFKEMNINFFTKFSLFFFVGLLLKTLVQVRKTSDTIFDEKKVYTNNKVLINLIENYDSNIIASNKEEADFILCANLKECNSVEKNLISLDCYSDLLTAYKNKNTLPLDPIFQHMNIILITNSESIIIYFKSLFSNNLKIITDSYEMAKKHNCLKYTPLLIESLEQNSPNDLIMDFFMLNSYNLQIYSQIMQEMLKGFKHQKIFLSLSRYSCFLDILIFNIFKEAIWCKFSKNQINNIVIPLRIGDLLDDTRYSLANEINNENNIILNNKVTLFSVNEAVNTSFGLVQEVISQENIKPGKIYEKQMKVYDSQEFINLFIGSKNIEYQEIWQKVEQISNYDKISVHEFDWMKKIDPLIDYFLVHGELDSIIMKIASIIFKNE